MPDQSTLLRFCEQCGQPFVPTTPNGRFCSRSCICAHTNTHRRNRVARICEQCSHEFQTIPALVKRGEARFCSRECYDAYCKATSKGWITDDGYRMVMKDGKEYLEHRLVMEEYLGRPLLHDEIVHHIRPGKESRSDNRIENLAVMSPTEHVRLHNTGRVLTEETKTKLTSAANRQWADPESRARWYESRWGKQKT